MSYFLTYLIYFLNILNKKGNSKILLFTFILLLAVLMGANTSNPDYYSYLIYYNNTGGVVSPDFGFKILNAFFNNLGFSYEIFRLLISLFSFYLIHSSIKSYASNPVFVYLLFCIYPFFLDIVQIRNFLMISIVIYSMKYVVEKNLKNTIKFSVLILIAASMHMAALIYLPIVFINYIDKNLFYKLFLLYAILTGILIGTNKDILDMLTKPIFEYFSQFDSRFEVYDSINTRYGYLLYWGMQLSYFFIIKWSKNIVQDNMLDTKEKKFVNLVYLINAYMLLFLPFYVFEITYYRYYRNILILNYIATSITYESISDKQSKIIYMILVLILIIFSFYVDIFIPHNTNIIIPIFKYNWILN